MGSMLEEPIFKNGGMRYGRQGPGVRPVQNTRQLRSGSWCHKVGCVSVRPRDRSQVQLFEMYALFTFTRPGISLDDVLYFKSRGTLVPYLTSYIDGDSYHMIYASEYPFDGGDDELDRQVYVVCWDVDEPLEVDVECAINPV